MKVNIQHGKAPLLVPLIPGAVFDSYGEPKMVVDLAQNVEAGIREGGGIFTLDLSTGRVSWHSHSSVMSGGYTVYGDAREITVEVE
jgi:hypothetical protein